MSTLAIDIGGTHVKLSVVQGGKIVARSSIPAEAKQGLTPALDRIEAALRLLCQEAKVDIARVQAIGLAFPGIVHPKTGKILSSPAGKFDDARSLDLEAWSRARFGLPLTIANDANAALAGEWHYGAARGCRSVVMVTLGTGIGSSAIIDGVPLRGEHGQAGNQGGHFVQTLQGRPCFCGNVGCAESEASGWAVEQLARQDVGFAKSALAGERPVDFSDVFRLAAGDELARRLRDHCLGVWAGLAVSLIHAYDPERVIFGGGVMHISETIIPVIAAHVDRYAWTPWGKVQVVAAALGNDAGMLGIGHLAACT